MIVQKSKELIGKLNRTNYRQVPDFGLDTVSERLIEIISNECKSTIFIQDSQGQVQPKRYGSDVVKENIQPIIRQLILNGGTIPKEVMSKIMYTNGMTLGVNSDIHLYKGLQEKEDGTFETIATTGNVVIDFTTLDRETLSKIETEVYSRFAKHFVLSNSAQLPKTSKVEILKEKILHGRENRQFVARKFADILKANTNYSAEIIETTVDNHLDYMYSDKFGKSILETLNTGTGLVPIESNKRGVKFNHLAGAVLAETQDLMTILPDINTINEDISQVYADVEAQLRAYSIDITQLNANEIQDQIKYIGKTSIRDTSLQKHLIENGYRDVNVGISNNAVKMVDFKNVPSCMAKLCEDIQDLVQSSDTMNQDEYLRRAVQLQYRFIRIHPFPDSNGRTSRALLNMMTIPKGILIEVPKEKKAAFVDAQRRTNEQMDTQGFFEALNGNTADLDEIEKVNFNTPTYEFISQNCIVNLEKPNTTQEAQNEIEHEQEIYE